MVSPSAINYSPLPREVPGSLGDRLRVEPLHCIALKPRDGVFGQPPAAGEFARSKQSGRRGAGAGGASLTSELAQKHRKVSRRVPGGHLEEHLGDPATVVGGVVDYMHEDCATAHLAGITSHEA